MGRQLSEQEITALMNARDRLIDDDCHEIGSFDDLIPWGDDWADSDVDTISIPLCGDKISDEESKEKNNVFGGCIKKTRRKNR